MARRTSPKLQLSQAFRPSHPDVAGRRAATLLVQAASNLDAAASVSGTQSTPENALTPERLGSSRSLSELARLLARQAARDWRVGGADALAIAHEAGLGARRRAAGAPAVLVNRADRPGAGGAIQDLTTGEQPTSRRADRRRRVEG